MRVDESARLFLERLISVRSEKFSFLLSIFISDKFSFCVMRSVCNLEGTITVTISRLDFSRANFSSSLNLLSFIFMFIGFSNVQLEICKFLRLGNRAAHFDQAVFLRRVGFSRFKICKLSERIKGCILLRARDCTL